MGLEQSKEEQLRCPGMQAFNTTKAAPIPLHSLQIIQLAGGVCRKALQHDGSTLMARWLPEGGV